MPWVFTSQFCGNFKLIYFKSWLKSKHNTNALIQNLYLRNLDLHKIPNRSSGSVWIANVHSYRRPNNTNTEPTIDESMTTPLETLFPLGYNVYDGLS